MLQMNCIICINLSLKVIFILQSQFVSHLDRMSSFRGASLPILSIPKTVSKSAVTHIGMHSPPSIHTPGYSMCTVSSSLSSFWGSHIPVKFFFFFKDVIVKTARRLCGVYMVINKCFVSMKMYIHRERGEEEGTSSIEEWSVLPQQYICQLCILCSSIWQHQPKYNN